MRKRTVFMTILVFAILVIIGMLFTVKSKWKEITSTFGPLNVMGIDDVGSIHENRSVSSFALSEKGDYDLSGSITVKKGTASCVITCDGSVIYKESFNKGDYQIKTDIFKDKKGEISMEISASDDVEGDYSIALYARERKFYQIIRRLQEY